jgi:hypothetical protein
MPTPEETNFLGQTGFQLILDRIPTAAYFTQELTLPSITLPDIIQTTPFGEIPQPGDRIRWNTFDLTFKVDESTKNYREIHDWMIGLGHTESLSQTAALAPSGRVKDMVSDGMLHILSSHKNVIQRVQFIRMFPVSLSGLTFTTQDADIIFLNATVQFRYSRYKFIT